MNELLFAFGNLRDEVMFITMTTPTIPPFHQKIFPHAKSDKVATDIYLTKNNPFRLYPDWVGALRPWREPISSANPKSKIQNRRVSSLIPSSLNPLTPRHTAAAFTLIELLAVITIIGILAGLTLGAAGAVRRHGANSTAKAEVAALQAACDRYYADNTTYPIGTASPATVTVPAGGTVLFTNLLGSATLTAVPTSKRYFEPKPAMVFTNSSPNYFIDPWGYAYGYNSDGTNAPLIWSTAGQTTAGGTNKWITSWPKM